MIWGKAWFDIGWIIIRDGPILNKRSKKPLSQGAIGKLTCHSIPKLWTLDCVSSEKKFLPLSHTALLRHPRRINWQINLLKWQIIRQINLLKLLINVCESILGTKSNKIARVDADVYKVNHALYVFPFLLLKILFINAYCIKGFKTVSRLNYRGIDNLGH